MIAIVFHKINQRVIAAIGGNVRLEGNNLLSETGTIIGIDFDAADYLTFDTDVVKRVEMEEGGFVFEPEYLSDEIIALGYKLTASKSLAAEVDELKARINKLEKR